MGNVFQDLWTRIIIDWKEWRAHTIASWTERRAHRIAARNVKRDNRHIDEAVKRAKIKNSENRKTYYIMPDLFGGINELTKDEIDFFTRKGVFPKMNYLQRLERCVTIITSNRYTQADFNRIKENKKRKTNGPGKKTEDS
jgi:hypothetical protein